MTTSTPNRTPARRSGGIAAKLSLVVAAVLSVVLVIFILQNTVHTKINFFGWNFDLAQSVSLLGAAVVGGVITLIVSGAIRLRRAVK
ncbi:lipopolysaccharide assembly protein LapA domain-containing protein [Mycobacterium sp. NPDC006124]|uniref:lipopolysaccharide assembly protein LapA domain-containing protein n=1 Tax=Mycobacterium sp. NPDC006124 TaxID=3156729 RepID=UPI0033A1B7BD